MIRNELTTVGIESTEVLKVLSYYNVFRHPLKFEEIHKLILISISKEELKETLDHLIYNEKVFYIKGYYSLSSDSNHIQRRVNGEKLANNLLPKAKRIAGLIALFPFVRFVGISGSLSKAYADENSDFDYFIITAKNRLWIARTILHLFKKITFMFNKQKCFCMNYFIDDSDLEIEDKNIFVLYELATLIPVYNSSYYWKFKNSNYWVKQMLPQFDYRKQEISDRKPIIKSITETCMSILPLNYLNRLLMKITDLKWRRKWKKANYPMQDYDLAFRTRINISKNHPKNHQKLLLTKLSDFL